MDKRRRDMSRNTESWWKSHYSAEGEVGVQAATESVDPTLMESIKFMIFGNSKFE